MSEQNNGSVRDGGRGVAVVTGGGRGIGAAVSSRLAADGFAVAVNYAHNRDAAQKTVDAIVADGGSAVAIRADISEADQAKSLIDETTERLGAPSVLVNNAGMNKARSARKQTTAEWDQVIAVNLSGAFYCTHAALPAMYENGFGRIVFIGSASGGRRPAPGVVAYGAAKAGLIGMAKSLAVEVARRGITVNTVIPGFVETEIIATGGSDALEALTASWPKIPAESVAATVSYLAGLDAAHVSGEEIGVWLGGPVGV